MLGSIGQVVKFASLGSETAHQLVTSVFGPGFQTPQGWADFLDRNIPARDIDTLLNRTPGFWQRENFQALYVACWIFHPVEKGSYMLQLKPAHYGNVKGAYVRLVQSGELQKRTSSHLSKKGASAHEGWDFLQGYKELLVQLEGETTSAPYLFLKCEGHPMAGAISTLKHALSFVVQLIMYATPVVYPASIVPEQWQTLYAVNPMVGVIEGFRAALLGTRPMPWEWIGLGAASASLLLLSGLIYFRYRERLFADVA